MLVEKGLVALSLHNVDNVVSHSGGKAFPVGQTIDGWETTIDNLVVVEVAMGIEQGLSLLVGDLDLGNLAPSCPRNGLDGDTLVVILKCHLLLWR